MQLTPTPGKPAKQEHKKMTTQKQIRAAFWAEHPDHDLEARRNGTRSKTQNYQTTDCRCEFCDWLGNAAVSGVISADMADRTTL